MVSPSRLLLLHFGLNAFEHVFDIGRSNRARQGMERSGRKPRNLIGRDPTDVKQEYAVLGRDRGDPLRMLL